MKTIPFGTGLATMQESLKTSGLSCKKSDSINGISKLTISPKRRNILIQPKTCRFKTSLANVYSIYANLIGQFLYSSNTKIFL